MRQLFRRIKARVCKPFFARKFKAYHLSSNIGTNYLGKGCTIIGKNRISIGKDTYIGPGSEIICLEQHYGRLLDSSIVIGDHVRITSRCRITCADSIIIQDDVLVAPDVFITDSDHGTDPTVPGGYSCQPLITKKTVIEKGVWLGQRVCVLSGTKIGKHSIIGANSVVTHDIPEWSIAVGAPARVVKQWDMEKKEWVRVNN